MEEVFHTQNSKFVKKLRRQLEFIGLVPTIIWDKSDRNFYLFVSNEHYIWAYKAIWCNKY